MVTTGDAPGSVRRGFGLVVMELNRTFESLKKIQQPQLVPQFARPAPGGSLLAPCGAVSRPPGTKSGSLIVWLIVGATAEKPALSCPGLAWPLHSKYPCLSRAPQAQRPRKRGDEASYHGLHLFPDNLTAIHQHLFTMVPRQLNPTRFVKSVGRRADGNAQGSLADLVSCRCLVTS